MRGFKRERKKGVWQLIVDHPRGPDGKRRQRSRTFHGTESQADTALARLVAEATSPAARVAAAKPHSPTLAEFLTRWLRHVAATRSPLTHQAYSAHAAHVTAALGSAPLADLTARQVQEFYTHLAESGRKRGGGGLAPSSVYTVHRMLSRALKQAVRWGELVASPMPGVDPPPRGTPRWHVLTVDETRRLEESTRSQWVHLPIVLGIAAGLRRGEVLALRWSDVVGDTLHVRRSLNYVRGKPLFGPPKKGRKHSVPLPPFALTALAAARAAAVGELVCGDEQGGHVHPSTLDARYKAALAAAGLPPVRFHDLRHGLATHLGGRHVPLKVISERLGHASVAVTLATYSHVLPGMQAAATAEVEDLFGPVNAAGNTTTEGSNDCSTPATKEKPAA